MPNNTVRHINIIGHQNPDTDSICSALAYAWLKNRGSLTGLYEARRAGHVNRETRFVLQHFGVEPPRLCTDVSPQIKDIDIRKQAGIDGEMSLRAAWNLMRDVEIDTLCIVDSDNELQGLITIKDIADANMDLFDTAVLAAADTRCTNLLETLEAELVVGSADAHIDSGNICIGTSPEIMEELVKPGDLVLVSNRYETQMCAIDCGAQAIIVCCGSAVPRTIVARAQEKGCAVLATPYDTYAAARLISTAAPVRHFMRTKELLKFSVNTPIEDAKKVMASVRHRYFPILDENGKYCGVVSRRNLLNLHRKQVILVDHNERTQAVDGLEQADILEIIDHHRIGSLETTGPVYFRNVPVGCTATILYQMYSEQGLTPSREIAGLLLSAILSDTLVFRSPTSTPQDEAAAKALAEAEAYPGPSIVIAYCPCINHGIKTGMGLSQMEAKHAVDCGYWALYRYNPQLVGTGVNPFTLDSKEPTMSFREFLMNEVRYASLLKAFPDEAEGLLEKTEKDAMERLSLIHI